MELSQALGQGDIQRGRLNLKAHKRKGATVFGLSRLILCGYCPHPSNHLDGRIHQPSSWAYYIALFSPWQHLKPYEFWSDKLSLPRRCASLIGSISSAYELWFARPCGVHLTAPNAVLVTNADDSISSAKVSRTGQCQQFQRMSVRIVKIN